MDGLAGRALTWALGREPHAEEQRDARALFDKHYAQTVEAGSTLFPQVVETLAALQAKGLPLAIVTNKPWRFAHPLTELLGISKHAGAIVCGDSCSHAKPHPKPLLLACEQMKLAPSDCVYVGDDRRGRRCR